MQEIDEYIELITKKSDEKVADAFRQTSLEIDPEKPFENFEMVINRLAIWASIAEQVAIDAGKEAELKKQLDIFKSGTE